MLLSPPCEDGQAEKERDEQAISIANEHGTGPDCHGRMDHGPSQEGPELPSTSGTAETAKPDTQSFEEEDPGGNTAHDMSESEQSYWTDPSEQSGWELELTWAASRRPLTLSLPRYAWP